MLRALRLIPTLLLCPALAFGQERWRDAARSATGTWAYDVKTLTRKGATVGVWLQLTLAKPDTMEDGKWVKAMLVHAVCDCNGKTSFTTADLYYVLDDTIVRTHDYDHPAASAIVPGSVYEGIEEKLCARRDDH